MAAARHKRLGIIEIMLSRKAHVLLIEDNAADAELMKQAIHHVEDDVTLHHVPDVVGALTFLEKKGRFTAVADPDVLLLDLTLPKIPGIEVLRIIKKHDKWKALPVVVLTAIEDKRDHQACLDLGATAVWVKPPQWEEYLHLVAIIRECLKDHEKPAECLEEHSKEL